MDPRFLKIYPVATTYATAIFKGDLVGEGSPTGIVCAALGGDTRPQVEILVTGAASATAGVVQAVYDKDMLPIMYLPASTAGDAVVAGYVAVYADPDAEYLVQEDGASTPIAVANILYNINAISTHTGNTDTGVSKMEIDSDSVNTTATLALKILRTWPGDTVASAYCRWVVKLNTPNLAVNATAV
jgi:hypothetical protein